MAAGAVIVVSAVFSGCRDAGNTTAPTTRVHENWVTGMAAAALGPDGKFVLPEAPRSPSEVTSARAAIVAAAFAHTFGDRLRGMLEREHGGPITIAELQACGTAYYATPLYQATGVPSNAGGGANNETKGAQLALAASRYTGPVWLVTLCEQGIPKVSMSVSTLATELQVEGGHISGLVPNDFAIAGIPPGTAGLPWTPEEAVELATKQTGRRITEVPELVLPPVPYAPQLARWRLVLEQPVNVKGKASGATRGVNEVYVGFGADGRTKGLFAADPSKKGIEELRGSSGFRYALTAKPAYATALEQVEAQP